MPILDLHPRPHLESLSFIPPNGRIIFDQALARTSRTESCLPKVREFATAQQWHPTRFDYDTHTARLSKFYDVPVLRVKPVALAYLWPDTG